MLCANRMCFTCLGSESKELMDINKMDLDKITYLDKLKYFITSDMFQSEAMEICWSCIKQLRVAYKFKETVLLSQEMLKKCSGFDKVHTVKPKLEDECTIKLDDKITVKVSDPLNATRKTQVCNNFVSNNGCDSDSSDYFLADLKIEDGNLNYDIKSNNCLKCGKEVKLSNIQEHECVMNENGFIANIKQDFCLKCETPFESLLDFSQHECVIEDTNAKENSTIKCRKKVMINRPKKYVKKCKPDVDYQCGFCDLNFNKRWKLQKHVNRIHSQEKKFVCTYCNRGFKQSYHLREHITSHTGERNYSCTICDKKFQRVSSQRRHIRSHDAAPGQKTKRTPFLCNICGKSFPFSNGVQRHMRIHLGIKKHECKMCDRKFTQSTHLHVHMRTHTGEKPYICDTCGEAFSLNASLQKHMAVHKSVKVEALTSF